MPEEIQRPTDHDINALLKLTSQITSIEYDTNGNISKITINTQDISGNSKTITITLTYDSNGNITQINKEVS